jgi:hypothetical protein
MFASSRGVPRTPKRLFPSPGAVTRRLASSRRVFRARASPRSRSRGASAVRFFPFSARLEEFLG